VASDKAYDVERRLNRLIPLLFPVPVPGPYTVFTPFANGWGSGGGWAKVRWFPGNVIFVTMLAGTVGTSTDGTQIATIPATDANGNTLRPAQQVILAASTNVIRTGTVAPDPATGNASGVFVSVTSAGSMFCHGVAGAATFLAIHAWFPTDTM
jgi:hypothetical protein